MPEIPPDAVAAGRTATSSFGSRESMEYEYIEDIAEELHVPGNDLQKAIDQLGITTLPMAVPPYGEDVSPAVTRHDAAQLRDFYADRTG